MAARMCGCCSPFDPFSTCAGTGFGDAARVIAGVSVIIPKAIATAENFLIMISSRVNSSLPIREQETGVPLAESFYYNSHRITQEIAVTKLESARFTMRHKSFRILTYTRLLLHD